MKMINDSLAEIRRLVAAARDKLQEIEDAEARLSDLKAEYRDLVETEIPDKMSEHGVNRIDLDPDGNKPAVEAKLRSYVAASIAAEWPEERRAAAFAALVKHGAGSLIKTDVKFSFGKGQSDKAKALALAYQQYNPEIKEAVHHASLTAWLKEQVEGGEPTPPLDVIGGRVGSKVEIKKRK
jgi:hypothetical protein